VLKSRRGLLAAGLAVVTVGALATVSTLNASAESITDVPAPAASTDVDPGASPDSDPATGADPDGTPDQSASSDATAAADGTATGADGTATGADATATAAADGTATAAGDPVPPAKLPWGARPTRMRVGTPGATSNTLRATGLTAAAADASGSLRPRARFGPKGQVGRNRNFIRTQTVDEDTIANPAAPNPPGGTSTIQYFYNAGSQLAETDGYYATAIVGKPTLALSDYHTLAELALQSADGNQIVEVGWNVDRVVNGDTDPHLFVYHWVNHQTSCYNGCGFVQYSPTVAPGATLTNGAAKRFGIQYFNGAWWIAYDSEWIGYFPESLWTSQGVPSFNRSGLIQTFGEVASASTTPCTGMGNGLLGLLLNSAMLSSVSYLNGPAVNLNIWSSSSYYQVNALSSRTFRYGGPGAC
jgi:hypothetical protein